VIEWMFNSGGHGSEGVNDCYFGSAPISEIKNFPYPDRYFPLLVPGTLDGLYQSLDLINGVSTISDISARILDKDNIVSDILKDADAVGQGARHQLVEVYQIESGGDWTTDKAKFRLMKLTNIKQAWHGGYYDFTAHDVQKDMQRDVGEPMQSTLAASMDASQLTFQMTDAASFELVQQPTYGSVFFVKIDDEIIMCTGKNSSHVVTVAASGRGVMGTAAATHALDAAVSEVIVLRGNPMGIALAVLLSTGQDLPNAQGGINGPYDIYPEHWGVGLDATEDVDVAEWEQVGAAIAGFTAQDLSSGMQYEFLLNKAISAKQFIESRILKVLGAFAKVHGNGRYGVRPYSDLANTAKENVSRWITVNDLVSWGDADLAYDQIINDILIKYDQYPPLSGKHIRQARFKDVVSISKYRKAKPLNLKADGVIPVAQNVSQLYQRVHLIGAQMSRPPLRRPITLLPKHGDVEVGDILRLTIPVRDPFTGQDHDRAVQVQSIKINKKTAEPTMQVISQHEAATFWQGGTGVIASLVLSPASLQIAPAGTHQLIARAFDQAGNQLVLTTISWIAAGDVTVDANGVVTGTQNGSGTVYAVAGDVVSNTVNITVQTLSALPVASVAVSPSTAKIPVGKTQQMSAQALDVNGDAVAGQTYSWASDDISVATVDSNGLVTAVAKGTANITATASSVASPPSVVTVGDVIVPIYKPPFIADVVYAPVGATLLTWDGSTDHELQSGVYYVVGDLTIAFGVTLTINGTVWIYGTGTFSNLGTIDGKGRGRAGAVGIASNSPWAPQGYVWYVTWLGAHPSAGGGTPGGYVGRGGDGGSHIGNGHPLGSPGKGGAPLHDTTPVVTIIGIAEDANGSWTEVAGVPDVLDGDGGGAGGAIDYPTPGVSTGGNGGNAGAGLGLFFRGIFNTTGLIDLRGDDGLPGSGVSDSSHYGGWSGGGGGAGGSLVALAERDVDGLPVLSVDMQRVLTDGGQPAAPQGWYAGPAATAGGPGAKIAQVIG